MGISIKAVVISSNLKNLIKDIVACTELANKNGLARLVIYTCFEQGGYKKEGLWLASDYHVIKDVMYPHQHKIRELQSAVLLTTISSSGVFKF